MVMVLQYSSGLRQNLNREVSPMKKTLNIGGPVVGTPSNNTVGQKFFDLHFEIGGNPPPLGGFYALTILGANGVKFEEMGSTPAEAVARVVAQMEASGMWTILAKDPGVSVYPFQSPQASGRNTAVSTSNNAYDPNAPKERPADLSTVPHPDCQSRCQAFDHFGTSRCKSICAQRSGL
jgi:hypothetical protein